MSKTVIKSKSEFASSVAAMKSKLTTLKSDSDSVKNAANKVENFDNIDVKSAATKLGNNFDNIYKDMDTAINNITNYASDILGFDVNDFDASKGEATIPYEDLFKSDGTAEGNAKAIWNFLKHKGLSDEEAAGVLGNIQAECGFRLDAVGDGGTSYGLIQWHNNRWNNLNNYCAQHGLDPSSLQGQLEFLWYESLDPEGGGSALKNAGFYGAKSATEAAIIFHDVVERSASSPETVRAVRGGYADNWYSKFKGTGPGTVDGSLTLSSKNWTSLVGKTASGSYGYSGAYVSSSGSPGGSYYSGKTSTTTTTTETTPIPTPEPEEKEPTRSELIEKMEEIKAEKVKLNFGSQDVDSSKFKDDEEKGYKVTKGHMSYELTDDDVDLLCSIVAASGGKDYDDSLAIISTILNRCEDKAYTNIYGVDPIAQVTAQGEMSAYGSGSFKEFLKDGNIPSSVREAVEAALKGVRNHNETTFDISKAASSSSSASTEASSESSLLDDLRKYNDEVEAKAAEAVTPTGEELNPIETLDTTEPVNQSVSQGDLDELGIKMDETGIRIE